MAVGGGMLAVYPQNQHRNVYVGYSALLQVPDELLKVRNAGGHLIGKLLYWHDLYSGINKAKPIKDRHLGGHVVNHEGILAELHFYAKLLFYKIHLPERALVERLG